MRQHEVMVDVEQSQLMLHAGLTLALCVDPAADRGHALADIEIQSVTVDGRIAPSTSASKPCVPLLRHTAPQ